MTISRAAAVCGGRIVGAVTDDRELGRIVIDSREIREGDAFAAYKGEKVDGHNYIEAAFRNGAACCIAERVPENVTGPVILVDDVQNAIEAISRAYRGSLCLPIVGITGSVGKTSAKEMISSVLSQRYRTLKTEANLNNQLGVPMTLSRITGEHEAAVVEMGISGFGEMTALAKMMQPDVAVFTLIGHAHLEFLGDLDGVLRAKTEMLPFVSENGTVILNGDDAKLRTVQCPQRVILCGLSEDCSVRAGNIAVCPDGTVRCRISIGSDGFDVHIPAYGKHLVYAALEAAAVGHVMGLTNSEIAAGIAAYQTVGRRGAVTRTASLTLVDDCYNANPDSVKSAIDSLTMLDGRHVCILSDMLEQGKNAPALHLEAGQYAAAHGIDRVLTFGELGAYIARGAEDIAIHFESREALLQKLPELLHAGDTVLVKASRGMKLDEVSDMLKELEL